MGVSQLLRTRIDWVLIVVSLVAGSIAPGARSAAATSFEFRAGDRVCLVGNTLADRMQHDGWLETALHLRFPEHHLVIRDLGFSGDELTLRLRSAGFGTPDEHLTFNKASVVWAFFGYNESYGDEAGLAKFRADLAEYVDHLRSQKFDGVEPPRVVLFSPIAHEDLHSPHFSDGRENNRRLALYTQAMSEVAAEKACPFVDLYHPTLKAYGQARAPLTSNGVHLTPEGNRQLAALIDHALFGAAREGAFDAAAAARVRAAVLDKNFHWYNRYRTVDGYSIFGGRADLKFVDDQTNRVVMQRELEVLDAMTANRDRVIWAAAAGRDEKPEDSQLPPFIPVKTNKPGTGPRGAHEFLDGKAAIGQMTVRKGARVELVASEKEFPELINPVQMAFDTRGRLWVAVWPTYPHWKPTEPMNDKLLILEDTNGDGAADRSKTFAGDLHNPTGFEFWNGGVIVAMAPDLLWLKDTDGDDQADVRVRLLSGLDTADTHHTANSFTLDPGGALYFQEGTFHHTQVESPYGPTVRCANAGVYRFEPRTGKFDVYVTHGFANPHGHAWDRWGQDFVYDGTGAQPYHGALFSGHLDYPHKHATPPQVYRQRTRPCPGVEILSSRHFPPEMQGNLLVGNVIGFQGILQYSLADDGASFAGTEVEPLLSSADPNFRPSDFEVGPDGAIYFGDWQNPIIGHMQHNLRDPSRDRAHGRVYRVVWEGAKLLEPPPVAGAPVAALFDLLRSPEDRLRYRARIELGSRDESEVLPALAKWVAALDAKDPEFAHHLLEALWLSQNLDQVDLALLDRVLTLDDFRARAAATRVLCYWRDRVPSVLERLRKLATDAHPRVRMEAIRAASFFRESAAVEVVLASAAAPSDPFIEFVRQETLRALEPWWKDALAQGRDLKIESDAAAHLLLAQVKTPDLLAMKPSRAVEWEILSRPGISDEARRTALGSLSKRIARPAAALVLDVAAARDAQESPLEPSLFFDLARLLAALDSAGLAEVRGDLERLATGARQPQTRQLALGMLVAIGADPAPVWERFGSSTQGMEDLVGSLAFVRDASQRASYYDRLAPLAASETGQPPSPLAVAAMSALASIRGKEGETFTRLAPRVVDPASRTAGVRALLRLTTYAPPAEEARPALEALLAYLREVPLAARAETEATEAQQLAEHLAASLPTAESADVRRALGELGIRVVRIGTVNDQMLFDQERLAAQAGRPLQIVFENTDIMPHNFVITQPGALTKIGQLAEALATQPGALERGYVPEAREVLLSSKLLQPRDVQRLTFLVPTRPGVYPYVCTFPGHWRRMYGALYVVEDLAAFQADPEGYLASHPLPIEDDLLKFNRPRRQWNLADLAYSAESLAAGRSFNNGKQLFQIANCVACHRLGGVGIEVGPDLAKVEDKVTPEEILKSLIEPSSTINDKFASYAFELSDGRVVTGMIREETDDHVVVVENPLAQTPERTLEKSQIVERTRSATSLMPLGMVDRLSREEILDLLAYLAARGNADHPLFAEGHHHGAHGK